MLERPLAALILVTGLLAFAALRNPTPPGDAPIAMQAVGPDVEAREPPQVVAARSVEEEKGAQPPPAEPTPMDPTPAPPSEPPPPEEPAPEPSPPAEPTPGEPTPEPTPQEPPPA